MDADHRPLFAAEFARRIPAVEPRLIGATVAAPSGLLLRHMAPVWAQWNLPPSPKGFARGWGRALASVRQSTTATRRARGIWIANSNSRGFFHWMLDVLQKLEYLAQFPEVMEMTTSGEAPLIIPADHRFEFVHNTLGVHGFGIVQPAEDEYIVTQQTWLVPDLAPTGNYRPEIVRKLRVRLRTHYAAQAPQPERVYITRANSAKRKVVNEQEILPVLHAYGFTVVDMDLLSFTEQVEVMLGVRYLVTIHGAALSHMLFMPERSRVLEIRAERDVRNHCYYVLATDLGHDYHYVLAAKCDAHRPVQETDLWVDPVLFEMRLRAMMGG